MSSNETKPQQEPAYVDAALLNRQLALSDFKTEDVAQALERGLNPNIQWNQADIEGPRQRGGCVIHTFDPESSWANYNTPLHMSFKQRQFEAAILLLKHSAQIDLRNALGRTPLHEAISGSDSEAIKFLIENGADLNAVSEERSFEDEDTHRFGNSGILPLHEAIRTWNLQAAKLLVEGGADLSRTAPGGWTVLDLALLERNELMINYFYRSGARFSEDSPSGDMLSPENLRDMAHVFRPEFVSSFREYSASAEPNCNVLLGTFFSLLSQRAGKPNPENIPGVSKCTQCVRFLREVSPETPGPFRLYPDRGSLSQSAKEGCCLCAIFEDALVHKSGEWAKPAREFQKMEKSPEVILTSAFSIFDLSITVHCEGQGETVEVYSLADEFMIDHAMFPDDAKLGTASPRALKTIRAWLDNCQAHHSLCSEGKDVDPVLPTRIIDVGNEEVEPCLYESNGERAPYLALSYCWGSGTNVTTTKESFRSRLESISLDSLPLTLRDAVIATRRLGFRFLWVDAICIIQDDADDWEREASQMRAVYANATITMSAHDSEDCQSGLFRTRQNRITSPVQIPFRVPKKYQEERLAHQTNYYVLPVHGEKELLGPSRVDTRAWTLQENILSTRVLHWGPGILHWECLHSHGSESDPEGNTHPYNSSCTNFMDVRRRKRVVQGRTLKHDISYDQWAYNEYDLEQDDSDDEPESPSGESPEAGALDQDVEPDVEGPEGEDGSPDDEAIMEEDAETEEEADPKKVTYLAWQKLVAEYCSRSLSKSTDKAPAFLGLSEMIAETIDDEFIIGVWKKSHFFPSLLWAAPKPGGRSRNQNYPSWTWASIDGKINYPIDISRATWEPSDVSLDVQTFGPSQNHATGSITLRSSVRKFRKGFKFWRYNNQLLNPLMTYTFGRRDDWETKSSKRLEEELTVVEGFRDLRAASPEAKEAGGWEGAGSEIYCVVIARIGREPPPKFGYPAFIGGRPKSLVCLCLSPVQEAKGMETEAQRNVFRRVGLCHFWDGPAFWKEASEDDTSRLSSVTATYLTTGVSVVLKKPENTSRAGTCGKPTADTGYNPRKNVMNTNCISTPRTPAKDNTLRH
ncbi:hypothetical protein O1611_g2903 [Lasiodiplodia mahajangana]|uniref:Uncharacterized protein n=1 Tax=Lasiodiplodia mahajangana TaxID=1108764 RepID=A0ACC2JTY3_9PEZI|nr:hypothetical protein O1611_g2903 [Lasiodiplodia mahajangana]